MKKSALVVCSLLALGCFAAAQEVPPGDKTGSPELETGKVPPKRKRGRKKNNRFANLFFRAFYMQYGENKPELAKKYYLEYLKKAGETGRFAPRAAKEAAGLLEKEGKDDQAQELRNRDIPKVQSKRRRKKGRIPGEGNPREREAWIAGVEKQIAAMKARLKKLRQSAEGDPEVEALSSRIERMSKILEKVKAGEIPPPRRWNQGRGRRALNLAKMDPDRREALLERILERIRKVAERLEQNGQADRSQALLNRCSRLEELVKREEWEEASKLLLSLRPKRGQNGGLRRGRRGSGRGVPPEERGGRGGKARGARERGVRREGGGGGTDTEGGGGL